MCTKQRYKAASEARRSLRLLRGRNQVRKDRRMHIYRCPECRTFWHIGHAAA